MEIRLEEYTKQYEKEKIEYNEQILQLKSQLINNQKTGEILNVNTLSLKEEYEELIKKNNQLKTNYENLKGEKTKHFRSMNFLLYCKLYVKI